MLDLPPRELKCPSYMSQVVKQALFLALESNSKQVNEQILQLLKNFLDAGLIGDTYMVSLVPYCWLSNVN